MDEKFTPSGVEGSPVQTVESAQKIEDFFCASTFCLKALIIEVLEIICDLKHETLFRSLIFHGDDTFYLKEIYPIEFE